MRSVRCLGLKLVIFCLLLYIRVFLLTLVKSCISNESGERNAQENEVHVRLTCYFTVVLLLFFAGIVKCCCANLGRAFYFQGVYTFAGEFNKYVSTSTSTALLTSLRQS